MSNVFNIADFRKKAADPVAADPAPAAPAADGGVPPFYQPPPEGLRRYAYHYNHAIRSVILNILRDIAERGTVDDDQEVKVFFDTRHPGVSVPPDIRAKFPRNCCLVFQHQFDHLVVTDETITATLRFGGRPWPVVIPADALIMVSDPSVNFGCSVVGPESFQPETAAQQVP